MPDTPLVILLVAAAMVFTYRLVKLMAGGRNRAADERSAGTSETKAPLTKKPRQGTALGEREVSVDVLPKATREDDHDADLTLIRLPRLASFDDGTLDSTAPISSESSNVIPIVYDKNADVDVATSVSAYFLVSAVGQSVRGNRAKNEDAYLILDEPPVFAVADGMGGYRGGEIASRMAVEALEERLVDGELPGNDGSPLPKRAAQLLDAVYRANLDVFDRAQGAPELANMGTTLVAARFSPHKQRVYIAHVGDSRCYVYRKNKLRQITSDHTVGALHATDAPVAAQLVRALGVRAQVEVDLILGKPRPRDRYLLCSDGLTRMISDERIAEILAASDEPAENARALVAAAEDAGAKDNITVIVIKVQPARNGRSSAIAS